MKLYDRSWGIIAIPLHAWAGYKFFALHLLHRRLVYTAKSLGGDDASGIVHYSFLNFACIQTRYILSCRFLFSNNRLSTRSCSIEKSGCSGCPRPFGPEVGDGDGKANDGDPWRRNAEDVDGAGVGLVIREEARGSDGGAALGTGVIAPDTPFGVLPPSLSLSASASALSVMVIAPAGADDPVNSLTNSSGKTDSTEVPRELHNNIAYRYRRNRPLCRHPGYRSFHREDGLP